MTGPPNTDLLDFCRRELDRLDSRSLIRRLPQLEHLGNGEHMVNGKQATLFAGNDYLGLADHPEVIKSAVEALQTYGCSASASRLISGNHPLYKSLEAALADFKGKEAALVYPTGYTANVGVITALAGPANVIYMDRLCHASLYDAARSSRVRLVRYPHNDLEWLARRLEGDRAVGQFIVTDGVFSMDGDFAPLRGLVKLAEARGCVLIVDDAHGTGILGPEGRGTCAHLGVNADLEVGTLSKSFGSLGGFVAGDRELIDFLVNKSRPFIFTTGLPPAAVAAAAAALRISRKESWRRTRVLELARTLRQALSEAGFALPEGVTPIIPLVVGDEKTAVDLSRRCLDKGIFIPAVRTPAVPKSRARLRMTISANHTDRQLQLAIEALTSAGKEMRLI